MNTNELAEINRYCDPYSILVVTNKRRLIRLKCPFEAEAVINIDKLKKGQIVKVEAVKINTQLQLLYLVQRKYYSYSYFKINPKEKL
jgi:hypothetical protein